MHMKMKARTGSAIRCRTVGRVCIAASLTFAAARAETDVKVSKEISAAGSILTVSPVFSIPNDEIFKGWSLSAYCREVPPAFAARFKDRTDASNGKHWSWFRVKDYTWTANPPSSFNLNTAGWPAGDYTLRYQYCAKKSGKDVYPAKDFHFTLTGKPVLRDLTRGWRGDFMRFVTHEKAEVQTRWKLEEDDDHLYFRIEADEPDAEKLVAMAKMPHLRKNDAYVFKRDCVEVNVDPTGKGESFYKIIVNPNGDSADFNCVDDNTGTGKYACLQEWASRAKISTRFGDAVWGVEIALPKGTMKCPAKDGEWGVSIGRTRYVPGKKGDESISYPAGVGKFCEGRTFPKFPVAGGMCRAWELMTPKVTVESVDGRITARVATGVMNRTGKFGRVRVRTAFESRKGLLGQSDATVSASDGVLRDVRLAVPVSGQGAALCRVEVLSSTGTVLCQAWRDVTVEYEPVKIRLVQPCYRDCVFETMKLQTIEGDVLLEEGIGKPLEISLTGPGTDERQTIASASATNRFCFAFAGKAKGDYEIKAGNFRKKIRNLPYRKNEVWFDGEGVCYRDGVKMMPFGWFSEQFRTPHKGLTIAQEYADYYRSPEDVVKRCRRADKHGMGFIGMPFHSFDRKYTCAALFGVPRMQGEFGLDNEIGRVQKRMVRMFVEAAREEPGFFAYYLVDEPEGKGLNPDFFVAVKDYISELDPYHPTIMLNYSKSGIVKYKDCADINSPDAYPVYYKDGKTKDPKRDVFDKARLAFDSGSASGWLVPQAFDWPVKDGDRIPRGPNYDEYREQIMLALAGNTKGFMLYTVTSYGVPSVDQNHSWRYVLDEVCEAWETFLAPSEYPKTEILPKSAEKSVFAAVKRFGGDVILIVENVSYEPVKAVIDASLLPDKMYLSDVGETQIRGHTLELSLAPSETRVYRSRPWKFSIRKTKRDLAELEAARRKPGNLCLAPKFLTWGEIGNFAFVKAEPYYPRMELSSAYSQYPTRNVRNFSYFLQDGFDASYPYVNFHSWGPSGNDTAPWVKVDFGEKKMFSKVVLCRYRTDKGLYTLRSAVVEAGGKAVASFSDDDGTAGDKVTLEFPPVEAESFTVRLPSLKNGSGGYYLTEIEAYR